MEIFMDTSGMIDVAAWEPNWEKNLGGQGCIEEKSEPAFASW